MGGPDFLKMAAGVKTKNKVLNVLFVHCLVSHKELEVIPDQLVPFVPDVTTCTYLYAFFQGLTVDDLKKDKWKVETKLKTLPGNPSCLELN